MNERPPSLPATTASHRRRAAIWLGVSISLIAGAWMISNVNLPVPPCGLKTLTGVPCPFCGGTRSAAALAQFDVVAALRWNPMVTAGLLLAAGLSLFAMVLPYDSPLRRGWRRLVRPAVRRFGWPVALGLAAANWIYLLVTLP